MAGVSVLMTDTLACGPKRETWFRYAVRAAAPMLDQWRVSYQRIPSFASCSLRRLRSGSDGVKLPTIRDAFELVLAALGETEPRARNQIAHRSRD
jgi:hypothetical protein